MTGREQEPWQRSIRQSREQRGWDITPSVEPSRRFPVAQPAPETDADRRPPPSTGDDAPSVWIASASFGKLIGFLLAISFLGFTTMSFWRFRATDGLGSLLAIAAAVVCAVSAAGIIYILRGLSTIRYIIRRDGITIVWMGQQRDIEFDDIRDAVYEPRGAVTGRGYEAFWPGYHVSTMQMRDGAWHSVATQPPRRRIRVVTRTGIHAISPHRPILFLGELARRRQRHASAEPPPPAALPATPPTWTTRPAYDQPLPALQPASAAWTETPSPPSERETETMAARDTRSQRYGGRASTAGSARGWLVAYRDLFRERLLGDQVASGLVAVGVMIPLLMAAFLYSQYEGISSVVPLHWNAHGDVDAVGTRRDLWRLPLIAALILILNTTLATIALAVDRFTARFLVAVTPAAQLIAFIALVRATN